MIVKKENVHLIVSSGGEMGADFLADLLNKDASCVQTNLISMPNNRFLFKLPETLSFGETENQQHLFMPINIGGLTANAPSDRAAINCSPKYYGFYFLMSAIKTILYKHPNDNPASILPLERASEFANFIGKDWHYHYEVEDWLNQTTIRSFEPMRKEDWLVNEHEHEQSTVIEYWQIDADELYFGDTESEYAKICQHWNLTPDPNAVTEIQNYAQANIAVVEKYLDCTFEEFVSLTDRDEIWDKINTACLRKHAEEVIF